MIAVDTNILVYAHRADFEFHARAKQAVKELAEGTKAWCIPMPCIHEFYRIVTDPKVLKKPSTPAQALEQLQAWLASPRCRLISETEQHLVVLQELALAANTKGAAIHDARIAAICLQNGVSELWTADRDFQDFPAQKARNPLVS